MFVMFEVDAWPMFFFSSRRRQTRCALVTGVQTCALPILQAGNALGSGNASEAIRLLQKIPVGDAASEARRVPMLAMAYVRENRPDEAVKTGAEYVRKNPQNSAAHLLYGTTLVAAGKRAEARAQYSEAYKLNPKNIEALLSLGSLDSIDGHYKDAVGRYETVLEQDPKSAMAMTALGRSEERRVGKECVSRCRSRWSSYH